MHIHRWIPDIVVKEKSQALKKYILYDYDPIFMKFKNSQIYLWW